MGKYYGMCIGGPLAGEFRVAKLNYFDVDEPPELIAPSNGDSELISDVVATRRRYWHFAHGDDPLAGFWVTDMGLPNIM